MPGGELQLVPPTNTTNVGRFTLLIDPSARESLDWLDENLKVADESGRVVFRSVTKELNVDDPAELHWSLDKLHVDVSGVGLHRLRLPKDLWQFVPHSLKETDEYFTADLLIGASDPGIARVIRCFGVGEHRLRVLYSERVTLPVPISESLVVRTASNTAVSCTAFTVTQADGSKAPQLAGLEFGMSCDLGADEPVTEFEVVAIPATEAGVPASFPPANSPYRVDEWLEQAMGGEDCSLWLPTRW